MNLSIEGVLLALLAAAAVPAGSLWRARGELSQDRAAFVLAGACGVLVIGAALALVDSIQPRVGVAVGVTAFLVGAAAYKVADWGRFCAAQVLHRRRPLAGCAAVIGAVGVAEHILLGVAIAGSSAWVTALVVCGVTLSNLCLGFKAPQRCAWVAAALAALLGVAVAGLAGDAGLEFLPLAAGLASGAVLTKLVDTVVPDALAHMHRFAAQYTFGAFIAVLALAQAIG